MAVTGLRGMRVAQRPPSQLAGALAPVDDPQCRSKIILSPWKHL